MATANVAGQAAGAQAAGDERWRAACAIASVMSALVCVLAVYVSVRPGLDSVSSAFSGMAGVAAGIGFITGALGVRSRRARTARLGLWLSALAALGFLAAAFSRAMEYEPYVNGVTWSPDSSTIGYSHLRHHYFAIFQPDGIWVVGADGSSEPRQLTGSGVAPVWSPDGATIAYVEPRYAPDPTGDLWLVDADGANRRELTGPGEDDSVGGPAWAPDGTRIAFSGPALGTGTDAVWIIDADGTNLRQVAAGGSAPDWSPDGTRIAFAGPEDGDRRQGIWVIDPEGSAARRVTTEGSAPSWSPDGTRILYVTWPDEQVQGGYWVVDADGTDITRLPGDYRGAPRWTTDGRITLDCPEGTCIVDADGGNRQVLVAGASGAVVSPDGTRVAHVSGVGAASDLLVTSIDGASTISLIQ